MSIVAHIRGLLTCAKTSTVAAELGRLRRSEHANVAMIFALSLIPITAAAGTGLDLARGMMVHAQMASALDAAALAVGGSSGLVQSAMQPLAQAYFNANYKVDASFGTPAPVTLTVNGKSVTVSTSVPMPTTLLQVVGLNSYVVGASSTVVWGQEKIWVSLVLDNTGSMSQADKTGLTKISSLKSASHQLLTMLQGASSTPGDVQVSIVPFARDVNVGVANASAAWLDWTDFTKAPSSVPSSSVGPGSSCPWSDGSQGYHCQSTPANGSSTASKIPSSGAYSGYICPSDDNYGHYYNGCFNSVGTKSPYTHTWIPNSTATWGGCVTDRAQSYDVTNTPSSPGTVATQMVAENSPSCVGAPLQALTTDWAALNAEIDTMVANGSTNQTIGLVWGWQTQSTGLPLSAPSLPANTQQIVIILSDGLNTQDRWYGDGSNQATQVDARMALACTNLKAASVTVYAVFVDLGGTQGNSTVLQNCASDAGKYFDLTSSSQIQDTFTQIGQQITNLRVSQ